MREKGLLSRLIAYSPRPARTAKEDFFTEVFAGVLERTPALARFVLSRITNREFRFSDDQPLTFETQASYPIPEKDARCRPDLVIQFRCDGTDTPGNYLIFIESKIDSSAQKDQLQNYTDVLKARRDVRRYLVFVTLSPEHAAPADVEGVEFRPHNWGDIYRWVKEWHLQSGKSNALVDELLTLMEDLHMSLDLSISELTSAVDYARNARRKLWSVIGKGWEESEIVKEKLNPGKTSYCDDEYGLHVYSRGIGSAAYCINYGFLLNPDQKAPGWQLTFPNESLPVAFAGLYKYADGKEFRRDYAVPIAKLLGIHGWHTVDDQWIARKLLQDMNFNQADLGMAYKRFFVESLDEIAQTFGQP